jgi:hypothetical protein
MSGKRSFFSRRFYALMLAPLLFGCNSEPVANEPPPIVDAGLPPEADAAVADPMPAGDSLPMGAISYFNRPSCPTGWLPFDVAAGRSVVPALGTDVGSTSGEPLADAEDRTHDHAVTATLELPTVVYAGIAGEANHGLGHGGGQPLKITVEKASAGLPYVQLLICQKSAAPIVTQGLALAGTLMFFASRDCPSGWGQTSTSTGRFLVGLPEKGTANQSFGGMPLKTGPQGQSEQRGHSHDASGTIETSAHGIALLSGGLADGYAKNDKHAYKATSDASAVDMPYIQLLQCQKL